MEYYNVKILDFSNVELVLLEIIAETGDISGYDINKLVLERGYRKWADIGTTSIYAGLDKLGKRDLVESFFDIKKEGRGPVPRRFKINEKGMERLRQAIILLLANCRERDRRFDLGMAGLPFISRNEALAALEQRKEMLKNAAQLIKKKYKSAGGEKLPFHTRSVFKHPLFLIKQELKFTRSVIEGLSKN